MTEASSLAGSQLDRLPNELLVHIFRLVCGFGPARYYLDTPYRSVQNIRNLAHTCAVFRQIIMGIPNSDRPTARPLIMADLPLLCGSPWVDAATGTGTPSLVVRADIPDPDTRAERALIRATSSISRVETMILRGREGCYDQYPLYYTSCNALRSPATRSVSVLTTLRLSNMHVDSLFWSRGLVSELPALRVVQLRNCVISQTNALLLSTTLTVLVLENVAFCDLEDGSSQEAFARILRSCSVTLRELIIYDEHLFGEQENVDTASIIDREPLPSNIAHLPALEKVSLRAHSYALLRMVTYLQDAPNLRIAHIAPIVGYTPFDFDHLCDHVLPLISKSLLRGAKTFDRLMLDRTYTMQFISLVATHKDRVLELSLLDLYLPNDPTSFRWDITFLRYIFPNCIRNTPVAHLVAEHDAEDQVDECRYLLEHVFPKVIALALHGMCAVHMMRALVSSDRVYVAPRLRIVAISETSYDSEMSNDWNEKTAQALALVKDLQPTIQLRQIKIVYDSIMAPLVGNLKMHPGDSDDRMKGEAKYMSEVVRAKWEEFTHSIVAGYLLWSGYDEDLVEEEDARRVLLM